MNHYECLIVSLRFSVYPQEPENVLVSANSLLEIIEEAERAPTSCRLENSNNNNLANFSILGQSNKIQGLFFFKSSFGSWCGFKGILASLRIENVSKALWLQRRVWK